jgi:hypothetical protein
MKVKLQLRAGQLSIPTNAVIRHGYPDPARRVSSYAKQYSLQNRVDRRGSGYEQSSNAQEESLKVQFRVEVRVHQLGEPRRCLLRPSREKRCMGQKRAEAARHGIDSGDGV